MIPVLVSPGSDIRKRSEPVDAGVGPEIDEDDFSAQGRRSQGRRIQPFVRAHRDTAELVSTESLGNRPAACRHRSAVHHAVRPRLQPLRGPRATPASRAPTAIATTGWLSRACSSSNRRMPPEALAIDALPRIRSAAIRSSVLPSVMSFSTRLGATYRKAARSSAAKSFRLFPRGEVSALVELR